MSSHPAGIRFSPFSSASQNINNNNNKIMQNQQQTQLQQSQQNQQQHQQQQQQGKNKNFNIQNFNYSDSETDLSNSIENLSLEERFVLRHTARVEPQGQENLQENMIGIFFLVKSINYILFNY